MTRKVNIHGFHCFGGHDPQVENHFFKACWRNRCNNYSFNEMLLLPRIPAPRVGILRWSHAPLSFCQKLWIPQNPATLSFSLPSLGMLSFPNSLSFPLLESPLHHVATCCQRAGWPVCQLNSVPPPPPQPHTLPFSFLLLLAAAEIAAYLPWFLFVCSFKPK